MSKIIIKNVISAILATGISSACVQAQAIATPKMDTSDKMQKMMKGMEKCYGVVKAGMNDCGSSVSNKCAGTSLVDSDKAAWLLVPKGTCNKIVGSSMKPPAADTTLPAKS
jgi:uncharacterized membrane protein